MRCLVVGGGDDGGGKEDLPCLAVCREGLISVRVNNLVMNMNEYGEVENGEGQLYRT